MGVFTRSRGPSTINARVLRIALIPSVALMIVGIGLSGYLALQGLSTRNFADNVHKSLEPSTRFIQTVQEERRLSTLKVVGRKPQQGALNDQRSNVDDAVLAMKDVTAELAETAPEALHGPLQDLEVVAAQLPGFRQRVDSGTADAEQVYEFYSEMIELVGTGIQGIARSATDAEVGFEQMISYDLFRSVEAQSRTHALLIRGIAQGLDLDEFHELAHQMGTYHEIAETMYPRMTPSEQQQYDGMKASPWWDTVVSGDNDVMARGPGHHQVTFDLKAWENAAGKLSDGLRQLYASHSAHAATLGAASGNQLLTTSLIAGGTLLLVTATSMVFALRRSRQLVRRLTGLRDDTLELAGTKMPEVVDRLGNGERIDVDTDVPWLNHGEDEIGQVANAFNQAQRQAIAATVQEHETRAGVRAVFLNIAHRNQVTAHRQLQVLDQAERSQEDPEQLQLLFELDHLATQGRRNAESLIILGGKQPGRQWRKPVELRDVLNGAVAETAQYTKVNVSKVADTAVRGDAVADMIHLLAELLDNATSFSPPQTDVDVRSAVVGRGVVIEIEDQGLGMEPEQLDNINEMLRTPPDFSVMALSEGTRIGLFVVAQLAARHDVRVTLRESLYGGVNAIVLIPTKTLASEPDEEPPSYDYGSDYSSDFDTVVGSGAVSDFDAGPDYGAGAATDDHVVPMPTPIRRNAWPAPVPEPDTGGPPAPRSPSPRHRDPGTDTVTLAVRSAMLSNGNGSSGSGHSNGNGGRHGTGSSAHHGGGQGGSHRADSSSASHYEPRTPPQPEPQAPPSPATSATDNGNGNGTGKPPLPRRTRRQNLAPQLHSDGAEPEAAEPEQPDQPPAAAEPAPERFQATMSAFQRGTRRARTDESDTPHPPRWPGDDAT